MLHRRSKQAEPDDDHGDFSALIETSINLLIIDCETHRFAIAGPIARSISRRWIAEIERAERSGRRIFCVPVADIQRSEIAALVAVLGYQEWPPTTIISPPLELAPDADNPEQQSVSESGANGSHDLRERELSAISRIGGHRARPAKSRSSNV